VNLITEANEKQLFEARFVIDGPFPNPQGLWNEVKKYTQGKDRRAWILVKDNQVLGYIECKLNESDLPLGAPSPLQGLETFGHVARIGVRKEERGKGLGKQLLKEAELWLQSQGKSGVWLDYLADNMSAEILYSHCGYQDISSFKDGDKDRIRKIAVKKW